MSSPQLFIDDHTRAAANAYGAMQSSNPLLEFQYEASSSAQLILGVAKAASSHLDLAEVLGALIASLKPIIRFDAIAVFVLEGDFVRMQSLHVEHVERKSGESVESILTRTAASVHLPRKPVLRHPLAEHPVSVAAASGEPYVCSDLEYQPRFPVDEKLLQYGVRSYISLPLLKRGELIGAVDFISLERRNFHRGEVQLLQDVSEIVSIAVSNALAFEEIKVLKEQLQTENRLLQDEIVQRSNFEEIVGSSYSLRNLLSAIDRVAPTDSTVLVTGETGVGKELIAHAIHRRSSRSGRALVKVNCAALPAELIASELFGHEKGAFTGALQQRIGRFEAAHGGTIFLDEIGELSQEMQIALLRVLQEKEFERVGGNRTIHTDVRVIAATNRNLQREVNDGRFRADLFYRLNVFPIHVPSLRERVDDIPILVDYFIARFARRMGRRIDKVQRKTLEAMQRYSWPGNIRELQNVIERGVILADSDVFRLDPNALPGDSDDMPEMIAFGARTPREQQKARIEDVLKETHGRIAGPDGAAVRLGMPASTLESKIRALRINKHLFRRGP